MRSRLALAASAAIVMAALAGNAIAEEAELAPEGVGLLPPPPEAPATLAGTPPAHPFVPDPAGGFSRNIFETDQGPDFKIVIRDYSFPANQQTRMGALPAGAVLHVLSGEGEVLAGNTRLALTSARRAIAPAGTALSVMNTGQQPLIVRVLTLEPK